MLQEFVFDQRAGAAIRKAMRHNRLRSAWEVQPAAARRRRRRWALPLCVLTSVALAAPIAGARAEEPAKPLEKLGARLFFDTSLSEPKGVSCAACHNPARAFSGDNGSSVAGIAAGAPAGALGKRKAPSLTYAAFTPPFAFVDKKDPETGKLEKTPAGGQFRDGRAEDLERQIEGPLFSAVEMNNPSKAAVVAKVAAGPYADLAREVFGPKIFDEADAAFGKFAQAIAAYERSAVFSPFTSKFDDVLRGAARFSKLEAEGFALFKDPKKGNCLACHVGEPASHEPKDWLFTDFTYDAVGAPRNRAIPENADAKFFDFGLCKRPGLAAAAPKEFEVESVCGAFKVPTLRNVELTAPYFHNASIATLRDSVAFYATRDTNPERWYLQGEKFNDLPERYRDNVNVKEVPYDRKAGEAPRLNEHEIDAITAFLRTLTDRRTD